MDILLLLGLLALWATLHQVGRRVKTLEAELEAVRGDAPAAPPAAMATEARSADAPRPARSFFDREADHVPEPPPRPEREEPEPENLGGLFERLVGGRLLIWVGGIALALGGVFMVAYSIEIGLITTGVRMLMAGVFGLLLLAAAEYARSRADGLVDPRMGQSLAGAGILVLYATPYGAHVLYGLIGVGAASGLMVAVTAAALVLSFRHGAPTAVMGLAGGFATPLLIGDPDAGVVPLLGYLALLDIALFTIAARRGWTWLAAAAVLLSFGWTAALLYGPADEALAAGLFVAALSIAASVARAGPGWHVGFIRPAAIGLLQLALLAARTDTGWYAWALYGLLAAASFVLARRAADYRWIPALALALALTVLAGRAAAEAGEGPVPWAAAGIVLLFGLGALPGARAAASRLLATATGAAAFLGPFVILRAARPELTERPLWGLAALLLAAGPLAYAWLGRRGPERGEPDLARFAAAAAAMILAGFAAWDLLPPDIVASGWLAVALAAAWTARRADDPGLTALALIAIAVAALRSLAMAPQLGEVAGAVFGLPVLASELPSVGQTLEVFLLPLPLLLLLHRLLPDHLRNGRRTAAIVAGGFAAAAAYLLFKQAFGLSGGEDYVRRGFLERTLITQALFLAGWALCSRRLKLPRVAEAQRQAAGIALTALAAARFLWFDLVVANPVWTGLAVGAQPVLNLLLPAYFLTAFWLYRARRAAPGAARSGLWLGLFLAALVAGAALLVRQLFHGSMLVEGGVADAESWGYSIAGVVLSIALLTGGVRLPDKALRLAGLVLLTATTLKVFLSDASALEGVLRILSFLVLGAVLIGIGKLYATVLKAEAKGRERSPA